MERDRDNMYAHFQAEHKWKKQQKHIQNEENSKKWEKQAKNIAKT